MPQAIQDVPIPHENAGPQNDGPQNDGPHVMRKAGTVVVDEEGRPLVVYRGEHGDHEGPGFQTQLGSISFGSRETAMLYATSPNDNRMGPARNPRIHACYLDMRRPVMADEDDPFIEMETLIRAVGAEKAMIIALEQAEWIENTSNWEEMDRKGAESVASFLAFQPERLRELYLQAFPVFDSPLYCSWFAEAGYDGAIHGGMGVNSHEAEYRIFDARQAIPAGPVQKLEPAPPGKVPVHECGIDINFSPL